MSGSSKNKESGEDILPRPLNKSLNRTALADRIDASTVLFEVPLTSPTAKGSTYRIIVTNEMDEYDAPVAPADLLGTSAAALAARAGGGDDFQGTARKAAKISIADAPTEVFNDLQNLIATLPAIKTMANHKPPITTGANSNRVAEEKRNIRIRVWLYAASRENDNDFHLILGRAPGLTPKIYMTMELSGLPPASSPHFAKLKAARDAYKKFFKNNLPGTSYQHYVPPIPVEIEGSLFFDINHATGSRPGPQKLRPNMPTVWEVHPISKIKFEP